MSDQAMTDQELIDELKDAFGRAERSLQTDGLFAGPEKEKVLAALRRATDAMVTLWGCVPTPSAELDCSRWLDCQGFRDDLEYASDALGLLCWHFADYQNLVE